jgi:multisubunit Na+/H+ antiporter MnhE subunit
VKHVLPWLAGWLALFLLWQLLAGEWNRREWIAGAAAAALAAAGGELARSLSGIRLGAPARALLAVPRALVQVFADFSLVMWALPRRSRGRVHTRRTDVRGSRSWTAYVANLSPNAFVIDVDDEHVTLHDLLMRRDSESPA